MKNEISFFISKNLFSKISIKRSIMDDFSRRVFLKSSAIGTAILAANAYGIDASEPPQTKAPTLAYTHVVFDARSCQSTAFAKILQSSRVKIYEIKNDVSKVYTDLVNSWRDNTKSVAIGLTSYETFFVMSKMASDYGLRTFYEGVHEIGKEETSHCVQTSQIMQDKILKSLNSSDWVKNLASNLSLFVLDSAQVKINLTKRGENDSGKEVLYSWILASKKLKGGMII